MKYFIIILVMCICLPCYGMKVSRTNLKDQTLPKSSGAKIFGATGGLSSKQIAELNKQLDQIVLCLSGRVAFADGDISNQEKSENLDAQFIVFTSLGAGIQTTIPHSLGRVPVGYIVVLQNKGGASLYHEAGDTAWTTSNIYLKSDAATTTYTILIF